MLSTSCCAPALVRATLFDGSPAFELPDAARDTNSDLWLIVAIGSFESDKARVCDTVSSFLVKTRCTVLDVSPKTIHLFDVMDITLSRIVLHLHIRYGSVVSADGTLPKMPLFCTLAFEGFSPLHTDNTRQQHVSSRGSVWNTFKSDQTAQTFTSNSCLYLANGKQVFFRNNGSQLCFEDIVSHCKIAIVRYHYISSIIFLILLHKGSKVVGQICRFDARSNMFVR